MAEPKEQEKKQGWPWWVKALLVAGLIAIVGSAALAQVRVRELREAVLVLNTQRSTDSLTIVELRNVPPDTVVEVQTVTDTLWRTRTVERLRVDTVTAPAPECPVCVPRTITDTLLVDRLQVDTVVHTVEVVNVVAKRRWYEFALVGGLTFAAGYLIGDSGDESVPETPGRENHHDDDDR